MKKQYRNIRKYLFLLAILGVSSSNVLAKTDQQSSKNVLRGVVVDEYNNPLSGVTINVIGEEIGAISEADGDFELKGIILPDSKISFSLLGYKTVAIEKGDDDKLFIKLSRDVSNSDQKIITAKDTRSKLSVTQAISTVTGEELSKTHHNTLGAALAGRLPGLIVRSEGNEPGSEKYTLNIRGTSTSTGRSPLILIDGMVSSDFDYINPNDVESVSVFKDAAAVALYGMQGGNGVISIVTKRGKLSKPSINVRANYSMQDAIVEPNMLSSYQYALLKNEASKNDGLGDFFDFDATEIQGFKDGSDLNLYPNNNWYDMFMKNKVQTENVDISATGGTKIFKYYTSLGYMHQDSPFKTDGTNVKDFGIHRFYVRSNVDVMINDFITGYMNVAARVQSNTITNDGGGTAGIMQSMFQIPPTVYGPLTPDGKVIVTPQYTSPTYARINRSGYLRKLQTDINANVGLNFDLNFITSGLSASAAAKFYTMAQSDIHGNTDYERWIKDPLKPNELEFIQYGTSIYKPITLTKGANYSYMSEFETKINYIKNIGDHSFAGNFLWNYQYSNPAGSVIQPYVRMTYGLSASYAFSNILYIDYTSSFQGSEQFKQGNRYGYFPSISGALLLSNFDFFSNLKNTVSLLKLRASYGLIGNDNMTGSRFLFKDQITSATGGYASGLFGVINESRIANPLITWEKNKVANIGVEFALLNEFILGVDLFHEDRTDVLTTTNNMPAVIGIPSASLPFVNNGHITNKGLDIYTSYSKDLSKDWSLGLNANISFNKNKIHELNELYLGDDYAYPYRNKGFSVGELWGYEIDYSNGTGYFNSQEEIVNSGLTYEGQAPRPGDFIYKDKNSDNIIDEKDMSPLGNTSIPKMSWGAGLDLRWKNLDLSVLFQGIGGFAQIMSGLGFYETANNGIFFENHLNAWTEERFKNGEKISAPALSSTTTASHKPNNYYLQDKSFVRLKNIEIGYTLPNSWLKKTLCDKIRLYVSGMNLLTFDKMKSNDLDVEMSAVDAFPVSRYFSAGLNVTF